MKRNLLVSLLIVVGLVVVSVGVGCIYWPAGIIAAGCSLMVLGVLVHGVGESA